MKRQTLKTVIIVLCAILAAELIFVGVMHFTRDDDEILLQTDPIVTTQEPTTAPTTQETEAPTAETTTAPTETEPAETEPREQRYVLTFVGDCTLGSEPGSFASQYSFVGTIGENYDYPFQNVVQYFENDDFTMINLECVFADSGAAADKRFTFRGPTAYTEILTGASVEAVTLANNHTLDFGTAGYNTTKEVLEQAGVDYVEQDKTCLITTESGLVIGLYADAFQFNYAEINSNVAKLREQGAEIVICAFHWGTEGSYRATSAQQSFAKAAIDAGADIVYGHHPHVLQKIEEYNGGIIYYSLGNFSFGGNNYPKDLDSAVLQQEVIRDVDGTVRLGELTIIPVSCSSMEVQNNFQPTPYPEGSAEYDRVLSKLDGTFSGPDLYVSYNDPNATEAPTDSTEAPTGTEAPGDPETPANTEAPAETQAPAATDPPIPAPTDPPAPAPTQAPAAQEPPADSGGTEE